MSAESWRPVAGDLRYRVSDQGRVSVDGAIVRTHGLGSGLYPAVKINGRSRFVHVLVLEAFVSPRPDGMECRHLNGDRNDTRLANLQWGSHSENMSDQVAHGTHHNAIKTHCLRGHELNAVNVYVKRNGARQCRPCQRLSEARSAVRKQVAA